MNSPESYHPFKSQTAKQKYLAYYEACAKKWPVDSESKTINTTFGQTFIRISGPENTPPLILLSGDAENSLAWIPQIEALSKDFQTYAIDNIFDFGRSIYTRPMKNPSDLVSWLKELFTKLELKRINLVGHSYGAWLSTLYALSFPDDLDMLVLLAPTTAIQPRFLTIIRAIIFDAFPTASRVERYHYWFFPDSLQKPETKKMVDEMIKDYILSRHYFKRRHIIQPTVLKKNDWQGLKVPTLFMVGENERIYNAKKAVHKINEVAPGIQTILIKNAGHDLAKVRPNEVNKEILNFLKK